MTRSKVTVKVKVPLRFLFQKFHSLDDASILFPNWSAPLIRVSLMNKTIGASFSQTISNWLTKEESREHPTSSTIRESPCCPIYCPLFHGLWWQCLEHHCVMLTHCRVKLGPNNERWSTKLIDVQMKPCGHFAAGGVICMNQRLKRCIILLFATAAVHLGQKWLVGVVAEKKN